MYDGKRNNTVLFRTKLNLPVIRQKLAPRSRLDMEINAGLRGRLTLVTAPAGYGKTTAVANCVSRSGMPAAWLSIDSSDNGLKRFWSYLIAALGRILPGVENRFSRYLYESNSGSIEDVVVTIVDELYKSADDFALVIDDYHLIEEPSIHESLALLLKHMPGRAHAVIISRSRPPFGSIRLQTIGEVKDISIADLQFTESEIAELCRIKGVSLSKNDVKAIADRTEGWAAGLYLFLESMERTNDYDLTRLFPGSGTDNRRIASYLNEEVMNLWIAEEKDFMLKTSILASMSGSLCDALTGRTDGKKMLERLSNSNAFIISTDGEGCWYRYHHLFSEFLQRQLGEEDGLSMNMLHDRAGDWYESNGYSHEAVDHYLRGESHGKAAAVIIKIGREMLKTGDFFSLRSWLGKLPVSIVEGDDMLCLAYSWALMLSGMINEAEHWIDIVDTRVKTSGGNREHIRQMEVEVVAFRGVMGIRTENIGTILHSIDKIKDMMSASVFCAYGLNFNFGEASLLAGMLGFGGRLSVIDREYAEVYEKARRDVIKLYYGYIPALMGEIYFERNNFDKAVPQLLKGIDEAENGGMAGSFIPSVITLARIMKARGDMDGAIGTVNDAETRLRNMGSIHLLPVLAAFRARLGIESGDIEAVESWMKINCLDVRDKPDARRMYELITLARSLIAGKDFDNAIMFLSRLLLIARKEKNLFYSIELLNLQAVAYNASGRTQSAMEALHESLRLGAPEGYERLYIEEGMPMAALLGRFLRVFYKRKASGDSTVPPAYIRKLLKYTRDYCIIAKTFEKDKNQNRETADIRPLTKREREVLRFLNSELTNAEIACALDISLNTVKVNCANIYRKLDVKNRDQATRRARELNLLQ